MNDARHPETATGIERSAFRAKLGTSPLVGTESRVSANGVPRFSSSFPSRDCGAGARYAAKDLLSPAKTGRMQLPWLPLINASGKLEELQRGRINAVPQTRRRRSIIKHVPQMRITPGAGYYRARNPKAAVLTSLDIFGSNRLEETRPTSP